MRKGDQLCILRAEVKTDADALNLLRLVAALTAIGIPLDDDCPYLETRELVEGAERRLVTWTLKAKSLCGQHDARKLTEAWHDPVWTTQNAEHPFAYITTAFRNAGLLAAEIARLLLSHSFAKASGSRSCPSMPRRNAARNSLPLLKNDY